MMDHLRHQTSWRLAALTLGTALTLTACGGGGGGNGGGGDTPPPTALETFQKADVVIGQPDFIGTEPNQNGAVGASGFDGLRGNPAISANGRLFISDDQNHRVLGYEALPNMNGLPADFVLGQPDFESSKSGLFVRPRDISIAGGKMAVANYTGSKVYLYDPVPADGTAEPLLTLGGLFSSCNANEFSFVTSVALSEDGKLAVADAGDHRVLIWHSVPTSDNQAPDLVLGQNDFSHCTENDADQNGEADATPSASTLNYPVGVWTDGKRLAVADRHNYRVLIWNTFPTENGQPADLVLGQPGFDTDDHPVPPAGAFWPYGLDSNGTQLALADGDNNRVLVWNTFPTENGQLADVVLGQSDFRHTRHNDDDQDSSADASASARTLNDPTGVRFHDDKLLISDTGNNRVLILQLRTE
ncbi:hypothetical protein MA04_00980 [Alcanivorax balearicus MACL04]|uniref:NHL repeat containing protein n=1 Tax=Alloalcanivorax balearicus MACL04 TaxID=1177182 RepID=A0ABT2QVY8_9GAMM|nr:hypothetical protein [Alloalcanivorax balearicus]MCU5781680.1 hypothetical protein [Alloalcanivorax balearicus MACL04]